MQLLRGKQPRAYHKWLARRLQFTSLLILWGLLSGCALSPVNPTPTLWVTPYPEASFTPSPLPLPPKIPTLLPQSTPSLTPLSPTPLPSSTNSPWLYEISFGAWDQVTAVAWSADGKLLGVSAGEHVFILATDTFQQQSILEISSWSDRLAFSPAKVPGMSYLIAIAAKDGKVQLWEALTGQKIAGWEAHKKGAKSLAFSPDGLSLATTGGDAMVRIWNVQALIEHPTENPVPLAEMIGGAYAIPDVSFSPGGSIIASVDIHDIRLRDPATQRLILTLRGDRSIFRIAFNPDGSRLAAAEMGNQLSLWDVTNGQLVGQWSASGGQAGDEKVFLWGLVFSPDGSQLAAGGSDGMITVWQADSGQVVRRFQAHTRAVTSLAFSPDNKVLVSGGLDSTLRIWNR